MNSDLQRILLVRLGGIGDVLCTLPAVEAIRAGFPNAFIGYAVEEPAYDLVNGHPAIDKVHLFRRRHLVKECESPANWPHVIRQIRSYRRELRAERYDLALDFQRNFKGAMHTLASGAKRKIGFTKPTAREFNHWFYREHIDATVPEHWVDKFLAMANAVGGKPEATRYRLPDAPESRERVRAFLAENHIESFVAMHPSTSSFDPARRWEPERFSALARQLWETIGLRTIVTWGPGERETAEQVVHSSGGHAFLGFESKSLLDLAELYRHARLYVGLDTGPMHLATAVGLPSVVLFGSGDPNAYGPRSTGSKVVANYKSAQLAPMESITVEQVMRAIEQVLASQS